MPWTREELEGAFENYQKTVVRATQTATGTSSPTCSRGRPYLEHAFGRFEGREEIRRWVTRTMTAFRAIACRVPASWHVVDVERGWVICEIQNPMEDPGDGTEHGAANITILHYAGRRPLVARGGRYNPMNFFAMAKKWCEHAEAAGNLPEDARVWREKMAKLPG